VLTDAYDHTLRKLNLVERSDPITQLIAKKIIEIHQRGERNPQKLSELTGCGETESHLTCGTHPGT
jgi:hypothetical protein